MGDRAEKRVEGIRLAELRSQVRVQPKIWRFVLTADGPGFLLTGMTRKEERTLQGVRGKPRVFKSLNTAAEFLLDELNVTKFVVITENYRPGRLRGERPDRAIALRGTGRNNPPPKR